MDQDLLLEYLPLYNDEQMKRHDVIPGISGYAQVNGRNLITWKEKFKLDLYYVENQSLFLDLKILMLTFKEVLIASGINSNINVTMKNLMEKTSYLIYGGGKHSRVVISVLEKNGIEVVQNFDADNNINQLIKYPFWEIIILKFFQNSS